MEKRLMQKREYNNESDLKLFIPGPIRTIFMVKEQ